jgi:hypothetical protein
MIVRRLFVRILRRLIDTSIGRDLQRGNSWEPAYAYRLKAAERRFYRAFLSAPTTVSVHDVDGVLNWLLSCKLLPKAPPPDAREWLLEFERTRKGTAAEHAWWAWKQLARLETNAELVIGRKLEGGQTTKHWWIILEEGGCLHLLEPSTKERRGMLRPLAPMQESYQPLTGIFTSLKARRYKGYLHLLQEFRDDLEPFARSASG